MSPSGILESRQKTTGCLDLGLEKTTRDMAAHDSRRDVENERRAYGVHVKLIQTERDMSHSKQFIASYILPRFFSPFFFCFSMATAIVTTILRQTPNAMLKDKKERKLMNIHSQDINY